MEVLESYENEMTVNVGQVTNNRVKQLEEITEGYRQQVASLEEDAEHKSRVLQEANARCRQVRFCSKDSTSFSTKCWMPLLVVGDCEVDNFWKLDQLEVFQ